MKRLLLLAGVALLLAAPNASGAIQSERLLATSTVQSWQSRPIEGVVYVHASRHGRPLWEERIGKCSGEYALGALRVWVRLVGCGSKAAPVRLRYVSLAKTIGFRVVLDRHP